MRGAGTSLVTLFVGSGSNIEVSKAFIRKELATALGIKDKANRMNVRSAIAAVEDALCGYKAVPSTGLAIFAGPCV